MYFSVLLNILLCFYFQYPKKSQNFHMLIVVSDMDNTRMSTFIENELNVQFEIGKVFYEFTEEEDFLFYREVVVFPKKRQDKVNIRKILHVSQYI